MTGKAHHLWKNGKCLQVAGKEFVDWEQLLTNKCTTYVSCASPEQLVGARD
jgi:hypothetical protein